MQAEVLAGEKGEDRAFQRACHPPYTHSTLSTVKLPFRLPEQASYLPNKPKHGSLIMKKQFASTIVSLCPFPMQRCVHLCTCRVASYRLGCRWLFSAETYRKKKEEWGQSRNPGMYLGCSPWANPDELPMVLGQYFVSAITKEPQIRRGELFGICLQELGESLTAPAVHAWSAVAAASQILSYLRELPPISSLCLHPPFPWPP